MKSFLRENKLELFLLGVPVLCLIILWNLNIYKIWYYQTPWENLGAPILREPVKIGSVDFFLSPSHYLPGVTIFDAKGYEHYLTFPYRREPQFSRSEAEIEAQRKCARDIQNKWRIEDINIRDARVVDARGLCLEHAYQYAVYQIRPNGDVWEKYINSWEPKELRKKTSNMLFWLIALSSPLWITLFWDFNLLKSKPDYNAN